ncbi:hypothetical protein DDZ14_08390 [Maritimibacter sp. 55A14]|uniref:hypothetical protein n=1 Tax=Maritimibacter sp. 55A14 TaxID=2174844 RepID=UPI000D608920|nr:hypothetical protein [Maritimibacter sp. 55A14]PWE32755.1 hypothetical protein DDZ14_08390 [Maritimibacter sp. 55A14]
MSLPDFPAAAPEPVEDFRSRAEQLSEALRVAVTQLRDVLRSDIECGCVAESGTWVGGHAAPRAHSLDADAGSADAVAIMIDAIRAGERLAGRPDDDAPAWLNDVLDGTLDIMPATPFADTLKKEQHHGRS